MPQTRQPGKLAVILHADIAGSTALVQQDEHLAHERIQDTFHRFGDIICRYHGYVRELRGDALLAEFERASDAVTATLAFQVSQVEYTSQLDDNVLPIVRVGIALGEVVIADNTITGAGVVLAQRLEQLAEPGGLCISSAIREALPARLPFQYGLLGEQKVKGFDEPVRVFFVALGDEATMPAPEPHLSGPSTRPLQQVHKSRWLIGAGALAIIVAGLLNWLEPWEPTVEPADPAKMAYALPDKPSVAVLPFENISKDDEQEYFSDGVTEDIITDLSKVSGLFVAAPDSSFAYKGSSVKIRRVAEDLGVRYVLEGSVQRSEDRIRINAKLIDAVKGDHIWAERFDRELEDVFDIQSEVAQRIAKALAVTIKAGEHERLFLKHTASIDAYDQFLRARRLVDSPGKDDIKRAEGFFKRAIELDPNFASAYAGLSFNYSVKARFRFGDSPDADKQHALKFAAKAIEVDPDLAWAYIALGGAHLANGDPDAAVEAVRHALILQPNSYEANLFIGLYLQFAGESAKAVEHLELAQRLNPVDTVRKLSFLGMAYFMNGNYEKSAAIWKKRMEKFPVANVIGPVFLAGSYAMLDRMKDASSTKEVLLAMRPDFHLSDWSWPRTYKKTEDYQRLYDAAIKAGIPVYPPLEQTADLRPALIVLPFANISNDPEQEYFSDGFTEDVTTALARVPGFLVTARNTAFTYKDKNVDSRTLGQELGVRYLLEGSVRKRGARVRLNAQLIETHTGNHVWAETFDRPLADIFVVQDELVDRIVGSVASQLRRHEGERALSASLEKLQAYDMTVRARMLFKQNEFASVSEARILLRKAIEVDPSYALAYSLLGEVENYFFTSRVSKEYASTETATRMVEATSRGIALAPEDAYVRAVHGIALRTLKRYKTAEAEAEQAYALAPNDPDVLFAVAVIKLGVGDYEGVVETIRKAWTLDPYVNPLAIGVILSQALFALGEFEESKETALFCLQRVPSDVRCQESLVRALGEIGPSAEARAAVEELLRLSPGYTVSEYKRRAKKNRNDPKAIDRWADGLSKAGVPD